MVMAELRRHKFQQSHDKQAAVFIGNARLDGRVYVNYLTALAN
jgi:hypothetical protein